MGCITRGQAVEPLAVRREQFPLPEFGKDAYVWLRALSSPEAIALFHDGPQTVTEADPMMGYRMIALSASNDDGQAIYNDTADVAANFKGHFASVLAMVHKINELSGIKQGKN